MKTIGVLLALEFEMAAVIDAIRDIQPAIKPTWEHAGNGQSFAIYEDFTVEPDAPDCPSVRLILAYVAEMNPGPTQRVAHQMLERYRLDGLAMLGVAGALSDDLILGDVVCAEHILDYLYSGAARPGAQTPGSPPGASTELPPPFRLQHGGKSFPVDRPLIHYIQPFRFEHPNHYRTWQTAGSETWQRLCTGITASLDSAKLDQLKTLVRDPPKLHMGSLASGSVLVASQDFARWLRESNRKLVAVEMEAAGLMEIAELDAKLSILILRGISDFADEGKKQIDLVTASRGRSAGESIFRQYAMSNVISLFFTLVKLGIFPPQPLTAKPGPAR